MLSGYLSLKPFVCRLCLHCRGIIRTFVAVKQRSTTTMTNQTIDAEITSAYRDYHGGYFKTLVSPEQSGGTFALMEMVLPQGAEPPLHLHTLEDETFYLLEGEIFFRIGEQTITAKPGDAVFAPRQVPHLFKIVTSEAKFITLISPGKLWEYFMEFSTPSGEQPIVVPPQGPPPPELIAQLVARMTSVYGISFV